jgi:mRNA-degrading endonuclease HigB of HigAB toxin-antitoxin module
VEWRFVVTVGWVSSNNASTGTSHDFAHADIVVRRTVFNIHGNDYRLIARINYKTKRVFILYILTHFEYASVTGSNEHDD